MSNDEDVNKNPLLKECAIPRTFVRLSDGLCSLVKLKAVLKLLVAHSFQNEPVMFGGWRKTEQFCESRLVRFAGGTITIGLNPLGMLHT
jgi:hypothetical protein